MDLFSLKNFQPFDSVRCLKYLVPLTLQINLYAFSDFFIILYN